MGEGREFEHFPSMCPIAHCSLGIAHCSFGMGIARWRSLQADPLLDESIELDKMLGRSLKTLRTRTDQAATNPHSMRNEQCPMSNAQ
jgi:hypothetical protein